MMTERYLVMPRGINVGTRNRVPMADLRAMTLSYAYLEKRLGVVATARNWNTMEKIVAKF